MVGGGMRQAGIIAAAGLFALENNRRRLQQDHDNARILAEGLRQIEGLGVEHSEQQTNMVFITPPAGKTADLQSYLGKYNILVLGGSRGRLVTHLGITEEDIGFVIDRLKAFIS